MTIDTKAKKPLRIPRGFRGAPTGKPHEHKSKSALAREAKERGERTFMAGCTHHGEHPHYASNGRCVGCQKNLAGKRWERTRKDAAALARHNERQRASMAKLREQPEQRAKDINNRAIQRMRELLRPETAVPTPEALAECAEFIVAAPEEAEMDHAVPLEGLHPITKQWVVSGLHVAWNLEPMLPRSNKRKSNWFDPENPLEFQKPYNSFPGGQFHGDIGEIEFMRYTTPTTLELMTVEDYRAAIIEAANEEMAKACA